MRLVWLVLCFGFRGSLGLAQNQDLLANYLFQGTNETTFRRMLALDCEFQVQRIAESVALEAASIEKLRTAVQGDLSRFYRELAIVSQRTKELDPRNPADMQQAWREIEPLQQKLQLGLLGKTSLTQKVLHQVLTTEQKVIYYENLRERELEQFRVLLRMAVADLEKSLPLTSAQRQALIKLAESKDYPRGTIRGAHVANVGFVMLGRVSRDKAAAVLDEQQMKTFLQLQNQYKVNDNWFQW